jgi:hypothetical protein
LKLLYSHYTRHIYGDVYIDIMKPLYQSGMEASFCYYTSRVCMRLHSHFTSQIWRCLFSHYNRQVYRRLYSHKSSQ